MFTGLVESMGEVARVIPRGSDAELVIKSSWPAAQAVIGESVAVSGVCLTVTKVTGDGMALDVSAETLSRTTLGGLRPGSAVNLERALKLGDRLGGHLVTGHVDCVGRLTNLLNVGQSLQIMVEIPPEHLRLVVEKGSVALDGASLTVNEVSAKGFSLNIIPHTLRATTLELANEGDSVNIETDLIGKYVARLMNREEEKGRPGLSREDLIRLGF